MFTPMGILMFFIRFSLDLLSSSVFLTDFISFSEFFLSFSFYELGEMHPLTQFLLFLSLLSLDFVYLKLTFVDVVDETWRICFIQLRYKVRMSLDWCFDCTGRHVWWYLEVAFHFSFLWWLSGEKSHSNKLRYFFITNSNK